MGQSARVVPHVDKDGEDCVDAWTLNFARQTYR